MTLTCKCSSTSFRIEHSTPTNKLEAVNAGMTFVCVTCKTNIKPNEAASLVAEQWT